MREVHAKLAELRWQIRADAQQIARLQQRILRLELEGRDLTKVRKKLSEFHSLHLKALAVETQLKKVLRDLD